MIPSNDLTSSVPTPDSSGASAHPVDRELRERLAFMPDVVSLNARKFNEIQRRIQVCMMSRGFTYQAIRYPGESDIALARRMNPLNEETAKRWGYHIPPRVADDVDTNAHTSEFDIALNGALESGEDGCAQPAFGVVTQAIGDIFAEIQATLNGMVEAIAGFEHSTPGIELTRGWSDCMAARGFKYASPEKAIETFTGSASIGDQEMRTRLADLACDQEVGFTTARSAYQQTALDAWLGAAAPTLRQLADDIQSASDALARIEGTG